MILLLLLLLLFAIKSYYNNFNFIATKNIRLE